MDTHVAVWGPEAPTPAQLKEFFAQIESGRITKGELQEFLSGDKDCFRFTDEEIVIQIPALPRPTLAALKARYDWIEKIESDTSPTEAITLRLATVLKSDEERIGGEIYERRLAPRREILLGIQHRDWLIAHQDELPEPARSAIKALLGKVYIDFPGLIVVNADGVRHLPCARQGGERWRGNWLWPVSDFFRLGRLAVSSK